MKKSGERCRHTAHSIKKKDELEFSLNDFVFISEGEVNKNHRIIIKAMTSVLPLNTANMHSI